VKFPSLINLLWLFKSSVLKIQRKLRKDIERNLVKGERRGMLKDIRQNLDVAINFLINRFQEFGQDFNGQLFSMYTSLVY